MTITLELPPDVEMQLRRAQGKDNEAYLPENVRRQLRKDVLPETEANLLQEINKPLAPETRLQRDQLLAIQQQRELTEAERETPTSLIDTVELASAKRWQSLADLAAMRGLTLGEIAQQLDLPLA